MVWRLNQTLLWQPVRGRNILVQCTRRSFRKDPAVFLSAEWRWNLARTTIYESKQRKLELSWEEQRPYVSLNKRKLRTHVGDLQTLLSEGSLAEQKGFLRSLIKKIVVDDGKIIITYTFPVGPDEGNSGNTEVLSSELNSSPGRTIIELFSRWWSIF